MSKQPKALRIANRMDLIGVALVPLTDSASAVIRRQHALIEEMREALKEAVEMFEVTGFASSDGCAMCRAAIAKAEAQQ